MEEGTGKPEAVSGQLYWSWGNWSTLLQQDNTVMVCNLHVGPRLDQEQGSFIGLAVS